MSDTYLPLEWIKAVHIIAIIAWMSGLLYLPRLFIYHCVSEKNSDKSETFKIMERRLLRLIMNPAMIVTFITGTLMTLSYDLDLSSDKHVTNPLTNFNSVSSTI